MKRMNKTDRKVAGYIKLGGWIFLALFATHVALG